MKRNEYGSDFDYKEFNERGLKVEFPEDSIFYGCGRYAINELIQHYFDLGLWKSIYMPSYFCYDVIDSISKTGINVKYYEDYPLADDGEIISNLQLVDGDVLFRMNYFGVRSFRDNSEIDIPVIEDHSHNLFSKWAKKSNADWCVASLRKSLPIPDGGILWSPKKHTNIKPTTFTEDHNFLSQKRFEAMVFKKKYLEFDSKINKTDLLNLFKETEILFAINKSSSISNISKKIIQETPKELDSYKGKNFNKILSLLNLKNTKVLNHNPNDNPFSLVLLFESKKDRDNTRAFLINNGIYPAVLWIIENENASSKVVEFSEKMLSIHIDFRYSTQDINKISKIINKGIKNSENGI